MIEIRYMKSEAGIDNCFDFLYCLKEYIPKEYINKDCTELNFYIHILSENGMYIDKEENKHILIWSIHYDCVYNQIPFTMVYDEDYDMVSFAVDKEYLSYKCEIAQHIKQLIETNNHKKS